VWLAGWAIGEVVAIGILGVIIASLIPHVRDVLIPTEQAKWLMTGAFPFVLCFLLVWATFWTIGGIAAITALLRSVAGVDRLRLQPVGMELERRAGPFRRVRVFDRSMIRRVRIRHHDEALVADTPFGTQLLTELGTLQERTRVCGWLREHLQLPVSDADTTNIVASTAPPGWEAEVGEDGSTRLMRRTQRWRPIQAAILWFVTGLVIVGWLGRAESGAFTVLNLPHYLLTLSLVAGSAWLTLERSSWLVRAGRLVFRRRIGPWLFEHPFEHARLDVESSTDSDGDRSYQLVVREGDTRRTILSAGNDDGEIVDCARWFAARTGFSLSIPHRSNSTMW
jgi:hypothetical protein